MMKANFLKVLSSLLVTPTEDGTIIVSESTCYHYVRLACEKYIELQAEDTNQIAELLAKMPL